MPIITTNIRFAQSELSMKNGSSKTTINYNIRRAINLNQGCVEERGFFPRRKLLNGRYLRCSLAISNILVFDRTKTDKNIWTSANNTIKWQRGRIIYTPSTGQASTHGINLRNRVRQCPSFRRRTTGSCTYSETV